MKTQNFVQLIGYLANDPVFKTTASGSPSSRLRMATNYAQKEKDGTTVYKATWHDIVAWDSLAESISSDFGKGSHVLVTGEIRYRTFLDRIGHKRYMTYIKATTIVDLDR